MRALQTFRADLHVHTCLSPCAEEEMSPPGIAREAKKRGLDVIGICDHNSTRNVAAVRPACAREGVGVIGGIEITSEEEVHILGLFDSRESLEAIQQIVAETLDGENDAQRFGDQLIFDEHGAVVGRETTLLLSATALSVERIVGSIHRLGGVAIASHVDREAFGMIGQLGFVPPGLGIDALEISSRMTVAEAKERIPGIAGYPLVRSSDAHRLEELGVASTTFTGTAPSLAEFRKALLGESGREIVG